jgi:hypothetical protein
MLLSIRLLVLKEGIRRKFNTLAAMKCPTGDPNIPEEVQYAKEISERIYLKCYPVNGEELAAHGEGEDEDSSSNSSGNEEEKEDGD